MAATDRRRPPPPRAVFHCHIPGRVYSSKNSKRVVRGAGGAVAVVDSAASARYRRQSAPIYRTHAHAFRSAAAAAGLEPPLVLALRLRMATRGRWDHVNMAQGPLDAMRDAGWFEDDSWAFVLPLFLPPALQVPAREEGLDVWLLDGLPAVSLG